MSFPPFDAGDEVLVWVGLGERPATVVEVYEGPSGWQVVVDFHEGDRASMPVVHVRLNPGGAE